MIQSQYPQKKITADCLQKFEEKDEYLNLFLVGFKAALSTLTQDQRKELKGMKMMVDTNFPKRRGLGYSNSISLACLLITLQTYKIKMNYHQMIENLWKFKLMVKPEISYRFQESSLLLGEMMTLAFLDSDK